jgi:hypothetical protein
MKDLEAQGYNLEIKQVAYEFQKGGNQMLRVWRKKSPESPEEVKPLVN